jgi:hypothetical protein
VLRLGNRKTLALDSDLITRLKEVARKRGITLSNYMRSLIGEALKLEETGVYAPRALREKRIEMMLEDLGFILTPKEVLDSSSNAVDVGRRVGNVAKELGINGLELIELLSRYAGNVIVDSKRIVLLRNPLTNNAMVDVVKGVSEAFNLKVSVNGTMLVVEVPRESIEASLSEFRERRSKRRA